MYRFVLLVACFTAISAYKAGAPPTACSDMVPQHGAEPQKGKNIPYTFSGLSHVRNDGKLELTLEGVKPFKGFMIQARNGNNQAVGTFKPLDNRSQTLDCGGHATALTHTYIEGAPELNAIKFVWTPPADYKGNVKFMATVVESSFVYWIGKVRFDVTVE